MKYSIVLVCLMMDGCAVKTPYGPMRTGDWEYVRSLPQEQQDTAGMACAQQYNLIRQRMHEQSMQYREHEQQRFIQAQNAPVRLARQQPIEYQSLPSLPMKCFNCRGLGVTKCVFHMGQQCISCNGMGIIVCTSCSR